MDAQTVINNIRSAFAGVPKPTDDVSGLDVFVDYNIHLVGPEALRCYFAEFVERSLQSWDNELLETLIFLLRHVNKSHGAWQISLLDKRQRECIRSLLRFLKTNNPFPVWSENWKLIERAIPLWDKLG